METTTEHTFKIGDKVRVNRQKAKDSFYKEAAHYLQYLEGDIHTIKEFDDDRWGKCPEYKDKFVKFEGNIYNYPIDIIEPYDSIQDTQPEKWYIKVTPENKHELSTWRTAGGAVEDGYLTYDGKEYEYLGTWFPFEPTGYPEITTEQFRQFRQITGTMNNNNNLPERYYIHTTTQEQADEVATFARKKENNYVGAANPDFYYEIGYGNDSNGIFGWDWNKLTEKKDIPVFEYQQWRELINNIDNSKNGKKVIGYRLLKSIPDISAGKTGYIMEDHPEAVKFISEDTDLDEDIYGNEVLYSTAICERNRDWFEPVYRVEEKILTLGDKSIEVKIGKGYIKADGSTFSVSGIEKLYENLTEVLTLNGYDVIVPTVKIGCQYFQPEELNEIIIEYNKLNP